MARRRSSPNPRRCPPSSTRCRPSCRAVSGPHPTLVPVAGARGASVPPDEADAARRVASLTPQQFRVLSMLCSGQSNKRIALQMQVSEATVKAHMTAILEKMGAENRTQAVLIAQRLALHQFAPPVRRRGLIRARDADRRAPQSARATPRAARVCATPESRACRPPAPASPWHRRSAARPARRCPAGAWCTSRSNNSSPAGRFCR